MRTLQRHIARWKATHGPEREVIFEQVHTPGERAQSDFTHMEDLNVTLAGETFPHLVFHLVLTYSNVEAVTICFSESFEALAEGIERGLWSIGGVPEQHRTDHLTAAVRRMNSVAREDFTQRYQALMAHYGMQPTWIVEKRDTRTRSSLQGASGAVGSGRRHAFSVVNRTARVWLRL